MKTEVKRLKDDHLYKFFTVRLQFRDRVYGGIPKSEKLIETYVSSKFGVENSDLAEKLKQEVDLVEETERVTTGFKSENGNPYLSDYQVKALLKQAANRLKITTTKRGSKQDITDGLFVDPKIFFRVNGKRVDGELPTEDFAGHVVTPQGKRSILKASEYAERASVEFTVRLIKHAVLTKDNLKDCFLLGQEIGFGSNRSFEKGKYDLLMLKKLKTAK